MLKLNRSNIRTVETTLSDLGFIFPRQFGPEFKPGALLTIKNGREEIVGDWSGCIEGFEKNVKTESIDLPPELESSSVDASVPKKRNVPGVSLRKFGINNLRVSFEKARIQSVDTLKIRAPNRDLQGDSPCVLQDRLSEDLYMVDSAIQATAEYQFYKNKSHVVLSEKELEEAGVLGIPGSANGINMQSGPPFYLAYTVRKIDRTGPLSSWATLTQTEKVRPGSSNFIFSISNQTLILPATRWRLSLFLNAKDLTKSAGLTELRDTPGVRIFSEEKFPGSYSGSLSSAYDELEISNNRKNLVDLIKAFSLPEERYKDIVVGVAETVYNDYKNHPDLKGVWYKPRNTSNPGDDWVQEDVAETTDSAQPNPDRFSDHAIHVAGLIAGRGDRLPGFAKGVKLFLVDTRDSSPATLEKQIDIGAARLVKLFNFSFTFGDELTTDVIPKIETFDNLRDKIRIHGDVLFIMAAGNNAKDLAEKTYYPIEWASNVANILGVGATDNDGNPLPAEYPCGAVKPCLGSNRGRTHVHLIAPGRDIYSTVTNGYAKASGTSQAAPMVTATAAALMAQDVFGASNIKMRLIYTADWSQTFEGAVWGGRLNFQRAVMAPYRNLVQLDNDPTGVYSIKYRYEKAKPLKIKISNSEVGESKLCRSYSRYPDSEFECEKEIPLEKVMRIIRYQNEKDRQVYRIMYLKTIGQYTYLKIINDAELEEITLPCEEAELWERGSNKFIPAPCPPILISTNLKDFTGAMQLKIKDIRF